MKIVCAGLWQRHVCFIYASMSCVEEPEARRRTAAHTLPHLQVSLKVVLDIVLQEAAADACWAQLK
jgi:hypothetical protein